MLIGWASLLSSLRKPKFVAFRRWTPLACQVELSCQVAILLVRLHHRQIVSTPSVRTVVAEVRELLQREIKKKRDFMGFNLAGVKLMLTSMKTKNELQ